ncbi:MAG: SpoIIE family protein phosphatase [Acidobacteria bacterium]|nr:SpoIIE family protein phosphatase [Acidobacteriota bacterium]
MRARIIERLLWDKRLSPRMEIVWFALVVLAPLALVAAVEMQLRILDEVPARATVPSSLLSDRTHALARENGIDARGWDEAIRVASNPEDSPSSETYRYLISRGESGRRLLAEEGIWSRLHVRLSEPEGNQSVEAWFSPTGRLTGYRVKLASHAETKALPEEDARNLATARLQQMMRDWPYLASPGDISHARSDDDQSHVFRWKLQARDFPELRGQAVVRIHERQVTQSSVNLFLSDAARRDFGEKMNRGKYRSAFIIFGAVLAIYTFVRYFKRRTQREVSRQRMLLVAIIIGCFLLGEIYLESSDIFKFNTGEIAIPKAVLFGVAALLTFAAGLLAGLSYSATEGDLREIDSRRITSLDGLLAGKLVSRNVGRSIVLGTVLMAWAALLYNIIYWLGHSQYPGSESLYNSFGTIYSRLPWVSLLLSAGSAAIFLPLASVFAPSALIWRKIRRPYLIYILLVIASIIPVVMLSREPFHLPMRIVLASVLAAGFLASFLFVDMLTTMVFYAEFTLFNQLATLSVTGPAWKEHEFLTIFVAVLIVAIATICAFAGRAVDEHAVRPAYAREIHERQQLESEVEAAREAQQRLLPTGAPPLPGITVAASCQAAASVSGDFYDFFLVGKSRLGILISDGGGSGLATALMIAFAKGFLMEKAQAGWSAVQTLRALEATLGEQLAGVSTEGLFYAVVDAAEGTCRYARIGATPGVFLAGSNEQPHEIRHQSDVEFWEGYARLTSTTRLVLYTNGVCRLIGEPDRAATNRWLSKRIGKAFHQSAFAVHDWIVKTVFTKRIGRGRRIAEEDVTVLVISVDKLEPVAVEHVA